LRDPHGLAIGTDGLLYVADHGNDRIHVFTTAGEALRTIGKSGSAPGELRSPTDVLIADDGRLIVVDNGNHRVQVWAVTTPK